MNLRVKNAKGGVPLGTKLRTFLRHFSITPLIHELEQFA
jgi:hypothetical protein